MGSPFSKPAVVVAKIVDHGDDRGIDVTIYAPPAPPPLMRGDIVGTVVDEGAGMAGYAYGVVVKAGPKQAEVRWQYGTGRYHQVGWRSFMRKLDGEDAAEAREALLRTRMQGSLEERDVLFFSALAASIRRSAP